VSGGKRFRRGEDIRPGNRHPIMYAGVEVGFQLGDQGVALGLRQFATARFLPQCGAHFEFVQVVDERLARAVNHKGHRLGAGRLH
jgi:hypothetical protein